MPDMFPPEVPSVGPNGITLETWLANPARVERRIVQLASERFLADRIFAPGPPATGGSVIYDQLLASDLYGLRDVQAIEPGSEFPIITGGEELPLVARTTKWGGAALLTYEERRRDRRDVANRKTTRLLNTMVRKVDTVAVATARAAMLGANGTRVAAAAPWSGNGSAAADPNLDVQTVRATVDSLDLGYQIDSAIIHPRDALALRTNPKIISQLPREGGSGQDNLVVSGDLRGVAGITDWYESNRAIRGEVIFLSGRSLGSISDEVSTYSRVVDQPAQERVLIMAGRLVVPFVTDPKSAVLLQGVGPTA